MIKICLYTYGLRRVLLYIICGTRNPTRFWGRRLLRRSSLVGGPIQVDIGGHPPFPTGSKQLYGNFGNLLFLAGFNFRGHFEGLNEGFFEIEVLNDSQRHD
jgi:hypothetical protein